MRTTRSHYLQILPLALVIFFFSCRETNSRVAVPHEKSAIQKACVDRILTADDSLGKIRNHACEKQSLELTIEQYCRALENLPFDDCPKDFTEAFKEHLASWRATFPVVRKYEALRGEMHDLFDQIDRMETDSSFSLMVDRIWSTWNKVEESAGVKQ